LGVPVSGWEFVSGIVLIGVLLYFTILEYLDRR